jgi:hypothetical protein
LIPVLESTIGGIISRRGKRLIDVFFLLVTGRLGPGGSALPLWGSFRRTAESRSFREDAARDFLGLGYIAGAKGILEGCRVVLVDCGRRDGLALGGLLLVRFGESRQRDESLASVDEEADTPVNLDDVGDTNALSFTATDASSLATTVS